MSEENKIPRIIHYCWFGGNPKPELALRCIDSWKRFCPDYEIIEWNEENFDITSNTYVREAYENKKWAFVTDVVRLYVLVNYGGIYMDTDVEVVKSLDELLKYEAVSGFESEHEIPTGLMASVKQQPLFLELLAEYDNIHFVNPDKSLDLTTNVSRITRKCEKYGLKRDNTLQTINGFTLLPKDYLCPKDYETKELNITENTFTIHHFDGSWHSEEQNDFLSRRIKYKRFLPEKLADLFAQYITLCKYHGILVANRQFIKWKNKVCRG